MTIPPDAALPVTLAAKDWNLVLSVLAEGPFRIVGPIIGEIQRQCMAMAPQPAAEPGGIASNRLRIGEGDIVQLPQRKPDAGGGDG